MHCALDAGGGCLGEEEDWVSALNQFTGYPVKRSLICKMNVIRLRCGDVTAPGPFSFYLFEEKILGYYYYLYFY